MRRSIGAVLAAAALLANFPAGTAQAESPWRLPSAGYDYQPSAACPPGATQPQGPPTFYRVCQDQMALLQEAVAEAKAKDKLLLVVFGATWCPSCRILHKHLPGPDVLGRKDEGIDYGRTFHVLDLAVSATANGRMVPVPSGQAALDALLAQAPGTKVRGVPFLAFLDPARPGRLWLRNTDDLERRTAEGMGPDPARTRAILRQAHDALGLGKTPPSEPGWLWRKLLRLMAG